MRPGTPHCQPQIHSPLLMRPTTPQINPEELGNLPVSVIGDTHGQFHDVLRL